MELRHLSYFHTLAEELNFSRAADRIHIGQSALSRQIAGLEQELGVRLFDRTSRGVELTPAGRALQERVGAILPTLDAALEVTRLTAAGDYGRLELGFVAAAMWSVLPSILREHRSRHPNLLFRLHELTMGGDDLSRVLDGSLDAAFVRPVARFRSVVYQPLVREQFVAILPEGHPQAARETLDLTDLAEEPFVLFSSSAYPEAYDLFTQACIDAGFTPTIRDQGDTANALYTIVASGFGVALAPASAQSSRLPGVVFRPFTHPTPEVELAIAYRKSNSSEALTGFLETSKDVAARFGLRDSLPGVQTAL